MRNVHFGGVMNENCVINGSGDEGYFYGVGMSDW